jgi:transcriptional regulator with XRE-family HTH domain
MPQRELLRYLTLLVSDIIGENPRRDLSAKEARKMLDLIKRFTSHSVRYKLTNDKLQYQILFRIGIIDKIKDLKGFKSDSELASFLGITRAYLSQLRNRKKPATHDIIIATSIALGNTGGNWWGPFEIVHTGPSVEPNSPIYNQKKYRGEIPYSKHSPAAEHRKLDYNAETQK